MDTFKGFWGAVHHYVQVRAKQALICDELLNRLETAKLLPISSLLLCCYCEYLLYSFHFFIATWCNDSQVHKVHISKLWSIILVSSFFHDTML